MAATAQSQNNWPSLQSLPSIKAILKRRSRSNKTNTKEKTRAVNNSRLEVKSTVYLNWVNKLLKEPRVTLDNNRPLKLCCLLRMQTKNLRPRKRLRSRKKNKTN